jgi:PAS domain S-box-containing protein
MITVCAMAMTVMTVTLYRQDIQKQREMLQVTAQSQARLIEAVARYATRMAKSRREGELGRDAFAATLSQIVDAQERYEGFGETGEFMLARHEGDSMAFVLRHRHGIVEHPEPIPFDSELAEPMRRALEGLSGTVIGLDYRGKMVLAAHEPVAVLDLGIVAKIDLAEIRAPFIRSGLVAAAVGLLVVLAGTILFVRVSNPLIARLEHARELERETKERKRAEETLRESEERFRTLVEQAGDAFFLIDLDTGRFVDANRHASEELKYSREEILALSVPDIGPPEQSAKFKESIEGLEVGATTTIEAIHKRRDGTTFPVEIRSSVIEVRGEKRVLALARNITARRRLEQDYRTLFREMLNGLALHEIICDAQGKPVDYRFLAVNPSFERMTGLKAQYVTGKTVLEVMPDIEPHWIERYGKVALTGEPVFFENYAQELGRYFEVTAFRPAPNQFACIFADITERTLAEQEREKLEAKLRQAQKMEAVGQLAGGVAHDFNNLLHAILGYGAMALDEAGSDSPVRASIEEVLKASERAKTLVKQLLAFSRRQVLEMKDVELNGLIADLLKMLRRVIGEHITLDVLASRDLGVVRADRGQIEQILMNLCVNARDAMPDGGRINIETENVHIDEEFCEAHAWAKQGRYVLLSVTDTGCGMDEETLGNIFEPFFTTKGEGEGTGLGLATVYGLVKQHQGLVHVQSEVGQGTTFKIYLEAVERSASVERDEIEGRVPDGTETLLLAEDDKMVRALCQAFLENAGYTVLTACDGKEALRVFDEHADEIDLALLDVMMPELGGKAVYDHIRSARPAVRVLFSSGYSMDAIHTDFILDEGLALIQKPYRRVDLLREVRHALG